MEPEPITGSGSKHLKFPGSRSGSCA